ncbi:MAG: hypothetical protein EA381_03325 [Planctomycetaceae bacterium]|nr:MAG: hypothetical protein EA381_03325 [Planctomycetaceae bacterium]
MLAGLLLSLASGVLAVGQDDQGDGTQEASEGTGKANDRPYSIEIIEFQLDASDGADLSSDELIASFPQMKRDGKLKRAETIRFFVSDQRVSFVTFGKEISLPTGVQSAGPGQSAARQVTQFEIGTTAEAKLVSAGKGQVSLMLAYRSSRLADESTDSPGVVILSNTMETELVFELGKTRLLGGTSANPNMYVLVTVSQ